MSARLPLTLACGDYEIVRALKEGSVEPDGIELTVLTQMDSNTRHHRFLQGREFDVAELSACSYVIARGLGQPFMSLPVFLHRRFRHGAIYINTTKGISRPSDLNGRTLGAKSWTATAILWMRGILESEYGVDLRSITWLTDLDDHVEGFEPPKDFKVRRIGDDQSIERMLAEGEVDALLHPDIIQPIVDGDPRVARLFPDYPQEQVRYYQKTGIFPIMHVLGILPEIVERHPWVPMNLMEAFTKAKAIAMRRMDNPRIVPLVLFREAWEEQQEIFGADPWEYGLGPRNVKNLETLVGYCYDQGLIGRRLELDELFLNPTAGSKRDGVFRY
jgi:4,5-dihydroxyphthalate decarboxylase